MLIGGLAAVASNTEPYVQLGGNVARMVEESIGEDEARALIQRCLRAEPEAVSQFQELYGELIYSYPIRVYRTPRDEAGDFYVFAFEGGRIFRRVQSFEGRTRFRTYLVGFVLDNLVLEWKRGEHQIETVSIDAIHELPDEWPQDSPELLSMPDRSSEPSETPPIQDLLADLEPSKAVLFKLLYIEDCEFNPAELRYLKKISGRRMPELLAAIEKLRSIVRQREAGLKRLEDALEGVHAWIQLYQRRLQRMADDLAAMPANGSAAKSLRAEYADLERKLEWRQRQRANLLSRAQRRKVTTPYKEIAALLGTTVGNVASQILRLRKELAARSGGRWQGSENGDTDV